MRKRVPIPELAEQYHPYDSARISATCTTLQANRHVTASSINQTLA